MNRLLKPVLETGPRPDPSTYEGRYVRSFLIMRALVGVLGIGLPFLLVLVDKLAFEGSPFPRGSLSAYYYSGVREAFVGILSATGVFLITYKVAERNLDNTLSVVAGLCALVIPVFPTGLPSDSVSLTPLQQLLGEPAVKTIHFTASGVFIVSLGLMSVFFGIREGGRPAEKGKRSPAFWKCYHWACACLIGGALVWIVATMLAGWPPRALLIGEAVSAWAFGASWLMKGLELDMLLRRKSASLASTTTDDLARP